MNRNDALELLRSIEWTCDDPDAREGRIFCPSCGGLQPGTQEISDPEYPDPGELEGHAGDCRLKLAIDELDGEHAPDCDLDEDCTCR